MRHDVRNFNIRTSAILVGVTICIGFLAVIFTEQWALTRLKVGGPIYDRLAMDSALVADVLPPPEDILEPYLEATLALQKPAMLAKHRARLLALHKIYGDRHRFWASQPISNEIKTLMIQRSDPEAENFWRLTEQQFLPALARGDRQMAMTAYAGMSDAYRAHRRTMREMIALVLAESQKTQVSAGREITIFTWVVWVMGALLMAVVAARVAWQEFFIVRPLGQMARALARPETDTRAGLDGIRRLGEIGALADAAVRFRDSLAETERLKSELMEHQIAMRSAEEANRSKTAFLANMSHELRTPLNAIIGFSDIFMMNLFGPLGEKYQEYARLINRSGLHLLDIISDVLDMAKIEAGRFELHLQELDIDKTVADCVAMILHKSPTRNPNIQITGMKNVSLVADQRAVKRDFPEPALKRGEVLQRRRADRSRHHPDRARPLNGSARRWRGHSRRRPQAAGPAIRAGHPGFPAGARRHRAGAGAGSRACGQAWRRGQDRQHSGRRNHGARDPAPAYSCGRGGEMPGLNALLPPAP